MNLHERSYSGLVKMNFYLGLVVLCGSVVLPSEAHVVAAWDFNASDNTASAGWTSFILGSNHTDTVGGITLTQAATGNWSGRAKTAAYALTNAPVLLAAAPDIHDDGFDLAGTQDFTLSGLVDGQQYRLQFVGQVTFTADAQDRNLTMTTDVVGSSTAKLFYIPDVVAGVAAGYSDYLEFTADAAGDVVITFDKVNSGIKIVGGLVVETTSTAEPVQPPMFIGHGVEGGTNFIMTWTSEEGQAFDLLNSLDLSSWSNLLENIPAAPAATQTTHAVAMDEAIDHQFFRVRRTDRRPPNIILLFADDLGYGDLACYGHPYAKTPNLDSLAEQGTMFRTFNVTGMTCNPSRTGLLSSWHPNSYALNTAEYGFDQAQYGYEDHPTIMELLHDAGYRTGHFGKWHIGPEASVTNGTYGIDEIILGGGGGNDPRGRDEAIYQDAIDFIVANQHTNFYINVMGRVTHSPVAPRPDLIESAGFADLVVNRSDFSGQQIQDIFDGIIANGGDIDLGMASYLTEIFYLDQFIGELLAKLDELGIADNTIVAFSSDQGAAPPSYDAIPVPPNTFNLVGWSGGLRGQKHDQHEGGVRSPFILRWPGHVPAGRVNTNSITSALDWLPTLCDVADVTINPAQFQGESVLDIWEGADRSRTGPQFWNSSMKKEDWRAYFASATSTNMVELYDLSTDFAETNNLVAVRPDIVNELSGIWESWVNNLP